MESYWNFHRDWRASLPDIYSHSHIHLHTESHMDLDPDPVKHADSCYKTIRHPHKMIFAKVL